MLELNHYVNSWQVVGAGFLTAGVQIYRYVSAQVLNDPCGNPLELEKSVQIYVYLNTDTDGCI